MPKKLSGKTGPDFPPNGMPSTLATPRRNNASKNIGVMNEKIKECLKLGHIIWTKMLL
jgi:hypothetical protein